MNGLMKSLVTAVLLICGPGAQADPIHARADGTFWHHESNWIFPSKVGEFALVGVPQDVAGSRDAVAYYAREEDGARLLAAVDVFPADSAVGDLQLEDARSTIEKELSTAAEPRPEASLAVGRRGTTAVTRLTYRVMRGDRAELVSLYYLAVGEWRVRIRISGPGEEPETLQIMDEFVRAQCWDILAGSQARDFSISDSSIISRVSCAASVAVWSSP